MHGATDGKDGVIGGVAETRKSLASNTTEKLEGKYGIQQEGFDEGFGGGEQGSFVASAGTIFEGLYGVEVEADVMTSAGENVVEGTPFVAIHFTEATVAAVVGTKGDDLRGIGSLINVAEGYGDTVDGLGHPRRGSLVLLCLNELFAYGDDPWGVE